MLADVKRQKTFDFNMIKNEGAKYKAIDLFAGIGGIRQGFEQIFKKDISFVFSSEIDKFAQITYNENFGELPHGDITKIDECDIPNFDILLAGFPCQPFSNAGLKKGFTDTRGTLFFDIARIIKHHKPKVVFLENVKGFKSHNKGNTFSVVKEILEGFGYTVTFKILNAKNFGVPQNRERIYIIGFLNCDTEFNFPDSIEKDTRLGDILEAKVDAKYTLSDKLWSGHQKRKEMHKKKGNGFGYSMFDEDSVYTSTISARYYKDGSEILVKQNNSNPRKLTPREAGRLQGFPEDFKIVTSDTQAYKQFGNSVAVPVIKALAKNIKSALENSN
jgi:DNA (cytosine-5)-methyltransferase 1